MWRAFLDNQVRDLVSIDFFTVPTARLRVLFVFIVLSHERRRLVHFNVTAHPTAEWTAQQILEAFPFEQHLDIWCETEIESMARSSATKSP